MNKKTIIGNIKMNLITLSERDSYLKALKSDIKKVKLGDDVEMVLCVPFVHLEFFAKNLKRTKIKLGVQNIFWQERGSFTGEISPVMAKEYGADYSIIGHSERRGYFKENNQEINLKIKSAIKNGIIPILCIGETLQERQKGLINDIISRQLNEGLEGISRMQAEKIIIAYEPVWAISTTPNRKDATSADSLEMAIFFKKILSDKFGREASRGRIIYGGSVSGKDAGDFLQNGGVDGLLPGRASLDAKKFVEIIKICEVLSK